MPLTSDTEKQQANSAQSQNRPPPPGPLLADHGVLGDSEDDDDRESDVIRPTKWSMGVLNDKETNEVPGSVLLLTERNEPLGLRNAPGRTSHSSLPSQGPIVSRRSSKQNKGSAGKKLTKDGQIILEPQPDDSHNDPLNWPSWKRDIALGSVGIYCMVGGGMTPILAAGFTNVAETYHTTTAKVALTTGLYMMGMGVGSVLASPTAILYGKRPVYLVGAIGFIGTSVWCAASPSYNSLLVARIFQGMSVSPVECLPSATIAEIFFLHERAYRIGIYGLLLLGGKNLVPLVSAAIIQRLDWRWVFWVCAMVGGFCFVLLFLFVPETFWDRTPVPRSRGRKASRMSKFSIPSLRRKAHKQGLQKTVDGTYEEEKHTSPRPNPPSRHPSHLHVGFAQDFTETGDASKDDTEGHDNLDQNPPIDGSKDSDQSSPETKSRPNFADTGMALPPNPILHAEQDKVAPKGGAPPTPLLHNINSPFYQDVQRRQSNFFETPENASSLGGIHTPRGLPTTAEEPLSETSPVHSNEYTAQRLQGPRLSWVQHLKPINGRLNNDSWLRVAIRPFILYAYPAVLWSSLVYSCSVGWLIVLSESVAVVYRSADTYGFSALSTGLIYISPFIGGVLGTAVAGKVSDVIVKIMSRRNGGLYEPEFRLVMAIPVAITTVIGLMGFGWSAYEKDAWIVPTIFFGVISFGCSLGSTTAITFCVDSYRQYAGEALVTLNFSKNVFHGLVFSLFFPKWLESQGSKSVFIWLGVIQLCCMVLTIPMFIYGKRARMWTVRKNLMERF